MNPLYRKIFILSVSIAAFAVGMTYLLVLFKVQGTHRELRHGRFELIAKEVDRIIEQSMALGLNFSELSALPQAMQRRQQADASISRIDILDARGTAIYSTEAERVGQSTPTWLPALGTARSGLWRYMIDDEAVAGTVVKNNFDVVEGYVAVRYSATEGRATREQLRDGLRPVALTAFGVSAAVLFIALSLLAWRFERDVKSAAARLTGNDVGGKQLHGGWDGLIAATKNQLAGAQTALTAWREQHGTISK